MSDSKISICLLFPDLLGTYGDGGNATVLRQRLAWREIDAEVVSVSMGEPVPDSCSIYLLGGGEDQPQTSVTKSLEDSRALHRAVEKRAVVLAVCAGMQVLGESFAVSGGATRAGLGLLDVTTVRGNGVRRVGELLVKPSPVIGNDLLTGYENHGGVTRVGKSARPLGQVKSGKGNDDGKKSEGAFQGRIVGTYLHGPVLARNPELADRLLEWATETELKPLDDAEIVELRNERLEATRQKSSLISRLRSGHR
jgi:lipid II isoglutaminyl synthase (glutamine-hydrolysing)